MVKFVVVCDCSCWDMLRLFCIGGLGIVELRLLMTWRLFNFLEWWFWEIVVTLWRTCLGGSRVVRCCQDRCGLSYLTLVHLMIKPMQPGFAENCSRAIWGWFDWKRVWDRLAFAIGWWFLTLSLVITALLATQTIFDKVFHFFLQSFRFLFLETDVQVSLLVPTAEQVRALVYRTWLGETNKSLEQLRSWFYHFLFNVDWNGENKTWNLHSHLHAWASSGFGGFLRAASSFSYVHEYASRNYCTRRKP